MNFEYQMKTSVTKKSWLDNVKEWTIYNGAYLLRLAESRDNWHDLVKEATFVSPQRASTMLMQ